MATHNRPGRTDWEAITLEEYRALMANRDRPLTDPPMAKRKATLDPPTPERSIIDWLIDGGRP